MQRNYRTELAVLDPIAQAEWFELVKTTFIEHLIGWDISACAPRANGGIFGIPESLYMGFETQQRGTLHAHGLLWIVGIPRTLHDWQKQLANDSPMCLQWKEAFTKYLAGMFKSSFPVSEPFKNCFACPANGCDGHLVSLNIPNSYHHVLKQNVPPPHIACCSHHMDQYTNAVDKFKADFLAYKDLAVDANAEQPKPPQFNYKSDHVFTQAEMFESIIAHTMDEAELTDADQQLCSIHHCNNILIGLSKLSSHLVIRKIQISRMLLQVQHHAYQHCFSCGKGGQSCCRYFFPRPIMLVAHIDCNEDMFLPYRDMLSQWLNTFVPAWFEALKINHDARFLIEIGSAQVAWYSTKYAVKSGDLEANRSLLVKAFTSHCHRLGDDPDAPRNGTNKALGTVLSLLWHASNVMEVPCTLAAYCIINRKFSFYTHLFDGVHLGCALDAVAKQPATGVVALRNKRATKIKYRLDDYMYRPKELLDLPLMDYIRLYTISRIRKGKTIISAKHVLPSSDVENLVISKRQDTTSKTFTPSPVASIANVSAHVPMHPFYYQSLPLDSLHPNAKNMHVFPRTHPIIPKVYGPRLPRATITSEFDQHTSKKQFLVEFHYPHSHNDIISSTNDGVHSDDDDDEHFASHTLSANELGHRILCCLFMPWTDPTLILDRSDSAISVWRKYTQSGIAGSENAYWLSWIKFQEEFWVQKEGASSYHEHLSAKIDLLALDPNDPFSISVDAKGACAAHQEHTSAVRINLQEAYQVAYKQAMDRITGRTTADDNQDISDTAKDVEKANVECLVPDLDESNPIFASIPIKPRPLFYQNHMPYSMDTAILPVDVPKVTAKSLRIAGKDARIRQTSNLVSDCQNLWSDAFQNRNLHLRNSNDLKQWIIQPALDALRHVSYSGTQLLELTDAEINKPFPSLAIVSRRFHLNHTQHHAFTRFVAPLVVRFAGFDSLALAIDSVVAEKDSDFDPVIDLQPLRETDSAILLIGEAGTGKSQVINAIQYFASAWNCAGSVLTAALTGVAAASINGSTVHGALNINPKTNRSTQADNAKSASLEMSNIWSQVLGMVIDEFSMMCMFIFSNGLMQNLILTTTYIAPQLLNTVDTTLRKLRQQPDKIFGGCILMLCGDIGQLAPVGGTPLHWAYAKELPKKHKGSSSEELGFSKFLQFNSVIQLTENHRFSSDLVWQDGVHEARFGRFTQEFLSLLESRSNSQLDTLSIDFAQSVASKQPLIITPRNNERHLINNIIIKKMAANGCKVYLLDGGLTCDKTVVTDRKQLDALHNKLTGDLPTVLPIFPGMRVRITKNQCIPLGLANGKMGTIFHISFPMHMQAVPDLSWGINFLRPDSAPTNIFIQIDGFPVTGSAIYPGLPPDWPANIVPVMPVTAKFEKYSLGQYPIVPGYALTIHGVQGLTVDALCIMDPSQDKDSEKLVLTDSGKKERAMPTNPASFYVLLSRVRTSTGVWLNFQWPRDLDTFLNHFKPNQQFFDGEDALEQCAQNSLAWFDVLKDLFG